MFRLSRAGQAGLLCPASAALLQAQLRTPASIRTLAEVAHLSKPSKRQADGGGGGRANANNNSSAPKRSNSRGRSSNNNSSRGHQNRSSRGIAATSGRGGGNGNKSTARTHSNSRRQPRETRDVFSFDDNDDAGPYGDRADERDDDDVIDTLRGSRKGSQRGASQRSSRKAPADVADGGGADDAGLFEMPPAEALPPKGYGVDFSIETLRRDVTKVGIGLTVGRTTQMNRSVYRATISCKHYGTRFEATAMAGPRAGDAENAAALKLAARLYRSEKMRDCIWPEDDRLAPGEARREGKAMLDVYNYCARHLELPVIETEGRTVGGSKKRRVTRCTVSLPSLGISGTAMTTTHAHSEILAAVRFKKAAEEHAAKEGGGIVVRDGYRLSLETAQKFHEWLKIVDRGYTWELEVKAYRDFYAARLVHGEEALRVREEAAKNPPPPPPSKRGRRGGGRHGGDREALDVEALLNPPTEAVEGGGSGAEAAAAAAAPRSRLFIASKRADAEQLAFLGSALQRCQAEPGLADRFAKALEDGNGRIARPLAMSDLDLSPETIRAMELTLRAAKSLPDVEEAQAVAQDASGGRQRRPLTQEAKDALSAQLEQMHVRYLESDAMAAMRKLKSELPMNLYRKEVLELVQNNVYSVIIGATGSGKTTQVPQIILEDYYAAGTGAECNIICTQPRRIAATSVAARVADEMGPELKDHVGYQVRFDSRRPRDGGSVTYCTTGILLQQLQAEPDRLFDSISHLVIDEVHERDKIIDFTLTILKRAVAARLERGLTVPRITLMSATLDTELFANYFRNRGEDGDDVPAPILSVPGRTFPVVERHLDDVLTEMRQSYGERDLKLLREPATAEYLQSESRFAVTEAGGVVSGDVAIDWRAKPKGSSGDGDAFGGAVADESMMPVELVALTIAHVLKTTSEGAVLVFFPGLDEMQKVERVFGRGPILGINMAANEAYKMYILHSSIPDSQKTVFAPVPEGVRKIILATNIAETSITIPDVRHVIDTGKVRETRYDHVKRISGLQTCWISKSNAKQRAGRAGRVQEGNYLALYSKARHQSLRAIGLPELLRSDLQTTCLDIRASIRGVDIAEFLGAAIEPPDPNSVEQAIRHLVALGAFTTSEQLTALGRLLASLPVHPALGKMIILGVLFRCLDPILVIGAAVEERSLFVQAPDVKTASYLNKVSYSDNTQSDHIALYRAFSDVRSRYNPRMDRFARDYAHERLVHWGSFKAIYSAAAQIRDLFAEARLIPRGGGGGGGAPDAYADNFFGRGGGSRAEDPASQLFGGPELNVHSHKPHVVKAILLAGMRPNLAVRQGGRPMWATPGNPVTMLPSGSVLNRTLPRGAAFFNRDDGKRLTNMTFGTFTSLIKSTDGNSMFIKDTSCVSPLTVALFSGKLSSDGGSIIKASDWIPFFVRGLGGRYLEERPAPTVLRMHDAIERMLNHAFNDLAGLGDDKQHLHDDATRAYMVEAIVGVLDAAEGKRLDADRLAAHHRAWREANEEGPSAMRGVPRYEPPQVRRYQPAGRDERTTSSSSGSRTPVMPERQPFGRSDSPRFQGGFSRHGGEREDRGGAGSITDRFASERTMARRVFERAGGGGDGAGPGLSRSPRWMTGAAQQQSSSSSSGMDRWAAPRRAERHEGSWR